jgi:putative pyruvate formate lyase activating enzyme
MPDLKYSLSEKARLYSGAADYPEVAKAAITEMYRQTGNFVLDGEGILQSGVLIRHLLLPGGLEDALDVIDLVSGAFPKNSVLFSLMSQYTPMADAEKFPLLSRPISESEHQKAFDYLAISGIENGYTQERSSAGGGLIPDFDCTGV